MAGVLTKGMLVDMPLALAEGMKNVPRLYGEEVPDHGKVADWQSGGKVAAKVGELRCESIDTISDLVW
jgi:hypothetical protein